MRRITAFVIALACTANLASADPGVRAFTFTAPHRAKPIEALAWYPANDGVETVVGENVVFEGTRALRDATPWPGKHPLIVLSHGAGGNAANLGWISARLVEEGFVVVAPNHPGSTSGDSRPETNIKAWERPQDISALISTVAGMPGLNVDQNRVAVLGFSMGGYTALALAGAKVKAADYAAYCDHNPMMMDCQWFAHGNKMIPGHVDLHKIDAAAFDAGYRDARVKAVVAIDPALAQSYEMESVARISEPVLVMNLGTGADIPLGVQSEKLASVVSNGIYETIAGAHHFTFLGLCKPQGADILKEEGDDPVCSGEKDRSRKEMHKEIATKIVKFLREKL